jgi:hypothetical protein
MPSGASTVTMGDVEGGVAQAEAEAEQRLDALRLEPAVAELSPSEYRITAGTPRDGSDEPSQLLRRADELRESGQVPGDGSGGPSPAGISSTPRGSTTTGQLAAVVTRRVTPPSSTARSGP